MLKIIKNGEVYAPDYLGKKDILIAGGKIIQIMDDLENVADGIETTIIDATGKLVVPGFIDAHVHICGGGSEGGFKYRTPELQMVSMLKNGITTVIGCLGTDGFARSMENLLAKAKSLNEQGVTAYCYTGSYQLPLRTMTKTIESDIMFINEIIGVGEVAINDHRASSAGIEELKKTVASARLGGILSGKAGIVNVHMGDGKGNLNDLYQVIDETDLPITQFLPTHMNRNPILFEEGIKFALKGGNVDFTTSTTEMFIEEGEVRASSAVKIHLDHGVSISQITLTSDGQGSLPQFNGEGELVGLTVADQSSLFKSLKEMVENEGIPLESALMPITSNPARILKLAQKGEIKIGKDADFVIMDAHLVGIETVIANGEIMVFNGNIMKKGLFE